MALKRLIKKDGMISEQYFAKDLGIFNVENGYVDVVDAVGEKLKEYCIFEGGRPLSRTRGGSCQDGRWTANIETEGNSNIGIEILQSYAQPGAHLAGAKVKICYSAPDISEDDVDIVRKALTSSGLEKIEA
jgi:hypothetical protein